MLDFLTQNLEVILLSVALVGALLLMGKRKALAFVKVVVMDLRDRVGNELRANKEKYANDIYAKLPKKVKMFISVGTVEKIIEEVADFMDID